jgi:hypothetical protein
MKKQCQICGKHFNDVYRHCQACRDKWGLILKSSIGVCWEKELEVLETKSVGVSIISREVLEKIKRDFHAKYIHNGVAK